MSAGARHSAEQGGLKIYTSQVKAMQAERIDALARRWLPLLRAHFSQRFTELHDEALVAHTARGIERGMSYELVADADLYRFVIVRAALGDAFDTDPALFWAQALLRGHGPPGPRLATLVQLAAQHLSLRLAASGEETPP